MLSTVRQAGRMAVRRAALLAAVPSASASAAVRPAAAQLSTLATSQRRGQKRTHTTAEEQQQMCAVSGLMVDDDSLWILFPLCLLCSAFAAQQAVRHPRRPPTCLLLGSTAARCKHSHADAFLGFPICLCSWARGFAIEATKVPSLGDSISEGTIVKWEKSQSTDQTSDVPLVYGRWAHCSRILLFMCVFCPVCCSDVGDYVEADAVLVVIETDQVSVDIRSPKAGVLKAQKVNAGDTVKVGQDIAEASDSLILHTHMQAYREQSLVHETHWARHCSLHSLFSSHCRSTLMPPSRPVLPRPRRRPRPLRRLPRPLPLSLPLLPPLPPLRFRLPLLRPPSPLPLPPPLRRSLPPPRVRAPSVKSL